MTYFKLEVTSSHPEKIDKSHQIKSASNGKKKVLRKRGKKNELKTAISGTENPAHRIYDSFISNLTLRAPSFVSQSHSDIISTRNFFKYSGDLNTGLIIQ